MIKIKDGMGGSRNGRSRREGTETLKRLSKKRRRQRSKEAAAADRRVG